MKRLLTYLGIDDVPVYIGARTSIELGKGNFSDNSIYRFFKYKYSLNTYYTIKIVLFIFIFKFFI